MAKPVPIEVRFMWLFDAALIKFTRYVVGIVEIINTILT